MKKKMDRKNNIYVSYLVSYLVMGFILLFLSLTGYFICQQTNLEKIQFSQDTILWNIQSGFDKNLENVVKAAHILAGSSRINSLSDVRKISPQDHLELQSARDELLLQNENAEVCNGISVFFPRSDLILTDEQVYPKEIKHLFYKKNGYQEDDLKKALEVRGLHGYVVGKNTKGEKLLHIVKNVYSFNLKEKKAVIILTISWNKMQQTAKLYGQENVYWMNSENIRLDVNRTSDWDANIPYSDFSKEGELIYTGKGADQIISSYRQSGYYDWKYCVSMREKDYFAELYKIRLVIGIQIFFFLAIAVFLAVFYSNQKYRPLDRILSAVRNNQRTDRKIQNLDEVEQYLEKIFEENSKLVTTWNVAQENKMGEIISGYIKGWNNDKQMVEETLGQKEILLSRGYLVFLITFRDISACKLFNGSEREIRHNDWKLLEFAFRNIFNEMILSSHKGLLLRMDNDYLCVASVGEGEVDGVCRDMKGCSDVFRDYLNLNLFVGISGFHSGIEELPKAYNESVQVLAYQTFWGNSAEGIGLYDNESANAEAWVEESLMIEDRRLLYNLMSTRQFDKAADLLDEMMDKMLIKGIRYTELNQSRMASLLDVFSLSLRKLFGNKDEAFLNELQPLERLMREKSVNSARRAMREIFQEIVDYVTEKANEEKPAWLQKTVMEIEENYDNPNLSLSYLSEKQNMNLAYMGRTFKQYMGYSVPDYIHMVRIREAKRLLQEGVSVKNVAEQVGYLDSKALIRIFKKQEGITPGQFKADVEEDV